MAKNKNVAGVEQTPRPPRKGGENAMSLSKAAAQLLRWGQNKEGRIDDLGLSETALICAATDLKDAHLVSEIYYSSDGVDDIVLTAAGRAYKV